MLVEIITDHMDTFFWNVQNAIDTVPDDKMNTILYDANIVKLTERFLWRTGVC